MPGFSGLASADFEGVFAHSYKRCRPRLFFGEPWRGQTRRCSVAGRDRRYIKGQKYTLLSRKENLTLDGKKALKTLLSANKRLNTAYVLKARARRRSRRVVLLGRLDRQTRVVN